MLRTRTLFALALSLTFAATGCRHTQQAPQPPAPTATAPAPQAVEPRAATARAVTRTLYIEPDAGFNWIYALVTNAKKTIDLTMYELVDTTFSADLVAACTRGVHVRVILDASLEKSSNTAAYNQLSAAGPNCSVAWSNTQFQATHEKSMVLDGTQAIIMSFNLTSRYYAETRDFAIVENDPADIAAIEATFSSDFGSTTDFSYQPGPGDDLIWSPTTAQTDLLNIIANAQKTLLVENEEMGASNIVTALEQACKRGVIVEIAMTDTNAAYHPNYTALQAAGCGVHIGANNATTLYIHAKAILADLGTSAQVAYVGSINFSTASMTRNRELGMYVHDAKILTQISSTIASDYAQFPAYK